MDILASFLSKVLDYTVAPIVRQMGYLYLYDDNVTELRNRVEELGFKKQRLQQAVDEAESNGNKIFEDVKTWLEKVDGITAEAVKLADHASQAKPSCSNRTCLNLKSRHQLSRKSKKKAEEISTIVGKGSTLLDGRVSYPVAPRGIGTEAVKGYEVFESREKALSEVIEALKSDNVNKIGVYGMGGVGKTMLVNEVARQAKDLKLFDKVVMTVVSQAPNVKEIQDKIAYVLKLKFDKVDTTRADKLRERLKREKSMLVIIDDIWEELDLEMVGISFGDGQKGCKLLFTSRSKDVLCNEMGCQKFFGVGDLSNDEARYLFGRIVGGFPEDIEFRSVADDVVKECAGLPIAITTVANALKNKRLPVWKDALHQLQTSNPTNIKGVPEKVYSSIELSYNFLSKEAKPLFLLCSLFGEDSEIPFKLLLRYGMGLDLFQDVYHLEEVRNRVYTLVENLKSSSLLLDGDKDDTVKMHDVIRDVAIHIASKAEHMFIVENPMKLQELSKQKKLKDSTALSMLYHDESVYEFLARLECSRLKLLLFSYSSSLQIPHPIFEGMKELRVLNLDGIDSQYLPSSISLLKNLQTLYLNYSVLKNIAFIGELENLKVLSLSESDIKEFPKEISQLTNLQVLDLSNCSELGIIPANVLSNLKSLEELYMENSFSSWEVEGESTEGSIARVTELDHLSHLTTLNICIPSAKFLPKALTFKTLVRYKICIGDDDDADVWDDDDGIKFKTSRTLMIFSLSLQSENLDAVKILLKSCEELYFVKLKGFQNIFYESSLDGFPRLKHLVVGDSKEFQFIIKGHRCVAFPALESFLLFMIFNLEKIWHGQFAMGSFHNLRKVQVVKCDKLKFVFSSSMVGCFPQLQKVKIVDCKVMSTVIATEREDETEIIDGMEDMMEFNELQSLKLEDLPNLKCFHSDVDSRLLFNEKVSFKSLTKLFVANCGSVKNLLSSSTARSLVQLKNLWIFNCEGIEEILAAESSDEKRTDNILFPKRGEAGDDEILFNQLESLELRTLPSLTSFSLGNCNIKFPSLKQVHASGCPELKIFSHGMLSTPKLQRVDLETKPFGETNVVVTPTEELGEVDLNAAVERFWEDNFNKTEEQSFTNKKIEIVKRR